MFSDNRLFTVQEVATYFSVSTQSIKAWIKSRKLEAVKVGRGYRITKNAIEQFMTNTH